MNVFCLGVLAIFLVSLFIWFKYGHKLSNLWMPACLWGVGAFALMVVIVVISEAAPETVTTRETYPVVALNDQLNSEGEVGGSFFFIQGQLESGLTWSWYEDHDGVLHPKTVSQKDGSVFVHEVGAEGVPEVTYTLMEEQTPDWVAPFNIMGGDSDESRTWDLVVPQGTITDDVPILDAK